MSEQRLHVLDYAVIFVTLCLSAGYGLFYGYSKNVQGGTLEYLLASRNIKTVPAALSYFATIASTGIIIGYPNEVYVFGFQIVFSALAVFPVIFVLNHIFFPIYHRIQSASIYEYLELRYNASIKKLVTSFTIIQAIILSSANIYGPSIVLHKVTGIELWNIILYLSVLCIIYTTLGGIRAVIFADIFQAILILLSLMILIIGGIIRVGGFSIFWQRNLETDRLDIFNFDINLKTRQTVWSSSIGYMFFYMSLTITSQAAMQRFMTTPTMKIAKRANILGNALSSLSLFLSQLIGLVAYAALHGCDPLKAKLIDAIDQLLPAFIMKVLNFPPLPGIIFTGILCASLSTLSSIFNSIATVIMISYIKPYLTNIKDQTSTLICKGLVILVGIFSILGVVFIQHFANVVQSIIAVLSCVSAPFTGFLLIGILFPKANAKVATASFLSSVLFLIWVTIGSIYQDTTPYMKHVNIDKCASELNITMDITENEFTFDNSTIVSLSKMHNTDWKSYFPLSDISFMWYSTLGVLSTFVIFAVLTVIFGKEKNQRTIQLDIIPPVVQKFHKSLPLPLQRWFLCDVYSDKNHVVEHYELAAPDKINAVDN